MNEEETKLNYITPAIQKAGWGSVEGSKIRMEFPITKGRLTGGGRRAKADSADYVLQYKGSNLAVVEAKRDDASYTEGVGQAKKYADRLHVRYTYSTNGKKIYGIDMNEATEGDVDHYPSPDELWEMTSKKENSWRDKLLSVPFESRGGTWEPRFFQENAINKVIDAIADDKKRILLTLATGTGKTAIAFQIAWKLFKARWNLQKNGLRSPRILFLADRNILADQAFNAFSSFEEDALVRITPKNIRKKGKVPTNGSVFFTIFQSFMSKDETEFYFGQYPNDFFDFIIIDECHRGGANDESSWRGIMEYFSPAVQLGLTATPKRDNNVDTYDYFDEPIYTYSLKDGINDGFLTPFRVKIKTSDLDTYTYKSGDTILEGEVEEGKNYSKEELDRGLIVIEDREIIRVKQFLEDIDLNEKSLVFCRGQEHALQIRDLINQLSPSKSPNYCHRVTAYDLGIGEQHLRDFQDNEKLIPTILTTSRKLSTGVDAPEVKNIVLFRPIKSMIEFKQIIGRGTRLFDGKDYFTVYDYVDAHDHFQDSEWDGDPEGGDGERGKRKSCNECNQKPCICVSPEEDPCKVCGKILCICEKIDSITTRIKLSDNSARNIRTNTVTTFWSTEGKPISASEFLKLLFANLPKFFTNEDQLRKVWSKPDTRKKLLEELKEAGYSEDNLGQLQDMINAEMSDLYDVLAYISFNKDPIERKLRAANAKIHLASYDPKQQEFLDFVLKQYVDEGFGELDDKKIPNLLELKYLSTSEGVQKLGGDTKSIRENFIDLQKHLYESLVA